MTSVNYNTGNIQDVPSTPPRSVAEKLYDGTAPVITNTQSSTSTIASAQKWAPAGVALTGSDKTAAFNYIGGGNFQIGTVVPDTSYVQPTSRYPYTYATPQASWAVEFMFFGQTFELKYKFVSSSTNYRLTVNDLKVNDLGSDIPGPPTAGSSNVLKVDLGSVDCWKIKFEFRNMPFGGIFTGPNDSLWGTQAGPLRLAAFGDSITEGSAMNTRGSLGVWLRRFSRLTGITDIWNQSRGGTGYIDPGNFAPLPDRIAGELVPWNFDHILIFAGGNDATFPESQLYPAISTTIKRILAECPGAQLTIVGTWAPTGPPSGGRATVASVTRRVAFENDVPYIDPQSGQVYDRFQRLVADFGPWITGTGRVGATTGSGNADIFIGSDAVHPTDAGHKHVANLMAASWLALFNQEH